MTKKHLLEVCFFVLVGIIIVAAGTKMFLYQKHSATVPANESVVVSEVKSEAEMQSFAADWQTYRNDEYSFEIKYPADWMVYENDQTLSNKPVFYFFKKMPIETARSLEHYGGFTDVNHISIAPWGYLPKGGLNISYEVLSSIKNPYQHVGGIDRRLPTGEVYYSRLTFNSLPETWTPNNYVVAAIAVEDLKYECVKKVVSEISDCGQYVSMGTPSPEDRQIQELMLSTFRFTHDVDTSEWMLYTFPNHVSYRFKYPPEFKVIDEIKNGYVETVVLEDATSPEKSKIILEVGKNSLETPYYLKYVIRKMLPPSQPFMIVSEDKKDFPKEGELVTFIAAVETGDLLQLTFIYTNVSGKDLTPVFRTIMQSLRDMSVG